MTMRIRSLLNTAPSLSLVALALVACGTTEAPPPIAAPEPIVVQPSRGIHLRAAFDDDPTIYVGRFIPNALAEGEIDETAAVHTRCSEHFGYKVVNTSQQFDEILHSSSKVAGALGVKHVAGTTTSLNKGGTLRVRYTLTKRMQVAPKDPAALARCCAAAPDQCSDKVFGEFLMGSGEVYEVVGHKNAVEAQGLTKTADGELSYKDDLAWKRVNTFNNMYFAFLPTSSLSALGPAPAAQASDDSCSWCDNIPTSLDGTYFCGISPPAPSEGMARDLAMRNAREQVVKYLGEFLTSESSTQASLVKGYLEDSQITTAVAGGIASQVKDQKWCKASKTNTPEGEKLTSKVLAFFPNAEKKKAAVLTIEAMLAVKSKDPKKKGDEAALKLLLQKVK